MPSNPMRFPIACAMVLAAGLISFAGPLDPPPGPPQPTMHTLDELYNKLVPDTTWRYLGYNGLDETFTPVQGSGVLHAVFFAGEQYARVQVFDGNKLIFGTPKFQSFQTGTVVVDVRYENGIKLGAFGHCSVSLFYRPDGQ